MWVPPKLEGVELTPLQGKIRRGTRSGYLVESGGNWHSFLARQRVTIQLTSMPHPTKVLRAKAVILNGVELFLQPCGTCGEETYREKHQRFCEACRKRKQKKRA